VTITVSRRKLGAMIAAIVGALVFVLTGASSCDNSNDKQNAYSDSQGNQALSKFGNPKITNFTEYDLAKEVAELRDRPNLVNYAYLQSMDGSLRCYGRVIGFGIPYGTQITPPYAATNGSTSPVREPNGLFMPDGASATWIRVIDDKTGKSYVDYVEPNLVVSQIQRPCKQLNQ
jgi:hypothetical protein